MRKRKARTAPALPPEVSARPSFIGPACAIFAVALVVRLLHVWQIRQAPFFALVYGDGASYDAWARDIGSGNWLGTEVFYQAPLYPYFLGAIYAIFGRDLLIVRLCQAALGSLACALGGAAGARLASKPVGIVTGLTLAFAAPAIFSVGVIQKSVLDLLFTSLLIWFASGLVDEPQSRRGWLWTGVALGCLSLTRENALVFILPLMGWLAWRHRHLGRERITLAAMLVSGLAAVLVPVAARNAIVGGGFYLTTSQFGPNFYIGNHAGADGTYAPLRYGQGDAEFERADATELAEQALGRTLSPGEVSAYWTGRTLEDIGSHPGAWLRLMARKFALLWNATEAVDTESQYTHAEWSDPLRLTGVVTHFGVIVPLAAFGIWTTWPRPERWWLLYLMAATYAASVLAFYVFTRYRYPLLPFLVLFASIGVVEARRVFASASRPRLAPAAATIAVAVFSNWSILSKDQMRATTENTYATALRDAGRLDQAVERYRRALALDPASAAAHNNLAIALGAQGRIDEATRHYEEAVRIEPNASSHYNLANVLARQGRFDEAVEHYQRSLALRPDLVGAHNNLGIVLQTQGRLDDAARHFQAAARVAPDDARAYRHLGGLFASQGKVDQAIQQYRRALEVAPDDRDARRDLGMALLAQGRGDEAIAEFRRGLEHHPDAVDLHNDIGIALAAGGQLDEAIEHFRRAVELDPALSEARENLKRAEEVRDRNPVSGR